MSPLFFLDLLWVSGMLVPLLFVISWAFRERYRSGSAIPDMIRDPGLEEQMNQ